MSNNISRVQVGQPMLGTHYACRKLVLHAGYHEHQALTQMFPWRSQPLSLRGILQWELHAIQVLSWTVGLHCTTIAAGIRS